MFIVEGNIGTGKSTFLKALQRSLSNVTVTLEAVDYWQDQAAGQSILQNFYESPHRWAYSMETVALKTRIQEHITNQASHLPRIAERSIYSGYHCFARNSFEQGFLNQLEWNVYQAWFNFLTSQQCLPPQGFIYLQADPQIAYSRTKQRNRNAEESISFAYLQQIHEKHEAFLIKKEQVHFSIQNTPVLVLDCNVDIVANKKKLLDYVAIVEQFVQTHSQKIMHSTTIASTMKHP